jgi:hypothetical protein
VIMCYGCFRGGSAPQRRELRSIDWRGVPPPTVRMTARMAVPFLLGLCSRISNWISYNLSAFVFLIYRIRRLFLLSAHSLRRFATPIRYADSPVHSYGPSIVVILYQVYPASSSVWFMTDCSLFDGVLFYVTIYALMYSSVAVNRWHNESWPMIWPPGVRPPTAGTSFDKPGGYTGVIHEIILRPFLPTVHIDGGGARLVLYGLVFILREIWC